MRIKEVPVYPYDEHPNKEKVLEKHRDINVDFPEWYDGTYEHWKSKLASNGYIDPVINFTGFWSQGDGASFTTKNIDLLHWLKVHKKQTHFRKLIKFIEEGFVTAYVSRITHQYYHANTVQVQLEYCDIPESLYSLGEELEKLLDDEVTAFSREIYSDLEKDYEYQTSEESVSETLRINEYEFELDGSIA